MLFLFVRFIVSLGIISCFFISFFSVSTRFSSLKSLVLDALFSSVGSLVAKGLLVYLFFVFLVVNLAGNVPLNLIPTMFYSSTLSVSLLFWVPLIVCVCYSDFKAFIAHMLPYGSPLGLMLFLPLIEIFSQLIRPMTLIIRLRTNLSSGHIMMYMFSYFTLLSPVLAPFIYVVLMCLFVLELCISALQAYIFVSLLALYVNETL